MGYVTAPVNGKSRGNRRRPVAAEIHAAPAKDETYETVVAEISARGTAAQHQRILLTQEELDQLMASLAPVISMKTRLEIAAASLHELNDSQLLALICEVLHGREKPGGVLKP